jgi:hypothetical protein
MAVALCGPSAYHGLTLRQSHAHMVYPRVWATVWHFENAMKELRVPAAKISEVMSIFHAARSDVLSR